MVRVRHPFWLFGGLLVFAIQNHCGVPGVDHDQLAVHFLDRGQHERALREARRAGREAPDAAQPHVIAALAHAGLGATEAAVASLEQALRVDPDDPRLYGTLRSLCAEAEREELALEVLERLEAEHPEHWLLGLNLGWAHRALGHDDEALQLLEGAVAADDTVAPAQERVLAHLELSRIYLDQERDADAARVLEGALLLAPDDPRLRVSVGECRLRVGDVDAAEDHFRHALDRTGDVGATASRIARVYYEADRKDRSIDYYEMAVRQHRPSPLVLNNLAWTYAEVGKRLERAHELSLSAVKTDADNVVYLDTYAEVLFRQGRVFKASALMRQCLEIEPVDGEHYEYLQGQLARFEAAADSLL